MPEGRDEEGEAKEAEGAPETSRQESQGCVCSWKQVSSVFQGGGWSLGSNAAHRGSERRPESLCDSSSRVSVSSDLAGRVLVVRWTQPHWCELKRK